MVRLDFNTRKIALKVAKDARDDGRWGSVKVKKRGTAKYGYFYSVSTRKKKK